MASLQRRLGGHLPPVVAVVTLCVAGLLAVFGFGTAAAAAAVVGWFLLTPLSALIDEEVVDDGGEDERATERRPASAGASVPAAADPVDRLRERYADGDIDEVEFERRLDLLLETEGVDVGTARERVGDQRREHERETERERKG